MLGVGQTLNSRSLSGRLARITGADDELCYGGGNHGDSLWMAFLLPFVCNHIAHVAKKGLDITPSLSLSDPRHKGFQQAFRAGEEGVVSSVQFIQKASTG